VKSIIGGGEYYDDDDSEGLIACGDRLFGDWCTGTEYYFGIRTVGGTWYPLGAAIAKIIEDEIPGTRVSLVNGVTVSNILGTNAGQYDLAMSLSTSNVDAIKAVGENFPQPQENIRGIVGFYSAPYQMAVPADSEIQTVADFAGKVINPGVVGGATDVLTQTIMEMNGVRYEDAGADRATFPIPTHPCS